MDDAKIGRHDVGIQGLNSEEAAGRHGMLVDLTVEFSRELGETSELGQSGWCRSRCRRALNCQAAYRRSWLKVCLRRTADCVCLDFTRRVRGVSLLEVELRVCAGRRLVWRRGWFRIKWKLRIDA